MIPNQSNFDLVYSYCNKTHEEAADVTRRTIHDYLPQLFQPDLLCAGYEAADQVWKQLR